MINVLSRRNIGVYGIYRYFSTSTGENLSKVSRQELLLKDFIEASSIIKPDELHQLKNEVLKSGFQINKDNFAATFINLCLPQRKLNLAKSYFDLIKSDLSPNNATIAKLLRLYYLKYAAQKPLPEEVQNEIYELCESFQKRANLLDSLSSESAILALSLTPDWKRCIEYLDYIRFTTVPTYAAYSTIVGAAFENGDVEFGWKYLKIMLDDDRIPTDVMYTGILSHLNRDPNASKQILNTLFDILSENNVKPSEKFIAALLNKNLDGQSTIISSRGKCQRCSQTLPAFALSKTEFELLRSSFYQNVIIGKNVYTKSTPTELEEFNKFVSRIGKYDIVIDGLNVAYSAGIKNTSAIQFCQLVANVVKYFVDRNQKVLVIGRIHMERWRNKHMTYILNNSSLFLAQNLSQDDPFLLYAAMRSGPKTGFVSRDLMRGHAFKLGDPKLKHLFYRWQNGSQYVFLFMDKTGNVVIKNPLAYLPVVQKCQDYWHIPVEIDSGNIKWTCLKL